MIRGVLTFAAAAFSVPAGASLLYQESGTLGPGYSSNFFQVGIPTKKGGQVVSVQFDLSGDDIYVFGTFAYTVTISLCDHDYERPECRTNETYEYIPVRANGLNRYGFVAPIIPNGINYFGGGILGWQWSVAKYDPETFEVKPVSYTLRITDNSVPEPATWALIIAGFGLVGVAARRRSSARITYA